MNYDITLQYYQLILIMVIGFLLFIGGTIAKAWIDEHVRKKMGQKPVVHGSPEVCGNCFAMQTACKVIPEIESKQEKLRSGDLPGIQRELQQIKTTTESLDKRVEKLFSLIEKDWMREISELRQALRDKNKEIEHLKHEGESE
ncbi:MAG: hypothetical protein AB1423_14510 [Pseudomonadota bacterium]